MNERERLIKALTCTEPDRPSYGDYFSYDSTRKRWECEGLPKKDFDSGDLFDYFGMDHIDIWGRGPATHPRIISLRNTFK